MGHATVSLLIGGSRLEPDDVTAALALEPSRARRARDPALRRSLGDAQWETGLWEYREREIPIDGVADAVRRLVLGLPENILERLAGRADRVMVSIGFFELRGTGEAVTLEPDVLAAVAKRGCALFIDVYGGPTEAST